MKYYNSHNVETETGRRKWQSETIRTLLSLIRPTNRNDAVPADQFIGPEAEGVLHQAHQAAHHSAEGNLGVSSATREHIVIQNAFGGTPARSGPFVDICLDLLLCESVPTTSRYQSKLLGTSTKCEFFAFQINGAVGLLLKLIGSIDPLALLKWAKIPHQSVEGQRVISAAGKLKHLTLHAAICADLTGFGETKLVLLAVQLYSILTEFNKPSLLVVPSALVSQWAAEIQKYWPYFRPILSYGGESEWESHFDTIKSKEMESKSWPVSLAAIMSGSDPMAKSAVILTSYDTHIRRTAYTEQVQVPGVPFAKPRFHEDGSPKWKKRPRVKTTWKTTHQRVFGLLLADEAHKVKNQRSGIWAVLYQQQYQTILLATATPMYNSTKDLVGLIELLGARGRKDLEDFTSGSDDEKAKQKELAVWEARSLVSKLGEFPATSRHRLMLLDASSLRQILRKKDDLHAEVAAYFSMVLDLTAIQRDTASVLDMSNGQNPLVMETLFKRLYQSTAFSRRTPGECGPRTNGDLYSNLVQATGVDADTATKLVVGGKSLRTLPIANCSSVLARMNEKLESISRNTYVAFLADLRTKVHGSPCLRVALNEILVRKVLNPVNPNRWNHHQKLIVVESQPVNAWFIETVLRTLLIGVRSFHSALNAQERDTLVESFNDPKSDLRVLVMTYDVGTVGLNLHVACDRIVLSSPGKSWGQESQAIGRCLRVTSVYPVTAIRCFVPNSHDQYRFVKQAAKASLQLAVNSDQQTIQMVLVKLLNNLQPQLDACHASPYGKQLLEQKRKADEERKAGLVEFLQQHREEWAEVAMNKLKDEAAGLGGSEIELPRWARRKALAKDHYKESAESDRESADQDYVPGAESEQESNDEKSDSSNLTEASESEEDLFDTIDLSQSLKKVLMVKFNTRESWKDFADRHQPDDNTRHLMALLQLPEGKKWSTEDLEESEYLRFGLLLLYNHSRGIKTLHLGSSIHIKYLGIPTSVRAASRGEEQKLKGRKRKAAREFLSMGQGDRGDPAR
ncbi:Helicase C-terminal [Penicillium canescens]|nr:Helicase C-terminal [Penicillium canescens]